MNLETRRDIIRCFYASKSSPQAALLMYKREKVLIRDPFTCAAISKLENTYSFNFGPRNGRPSFVKKREGIIENAIESNKNDFGSCLTRLISQKMEFAKVWCIQ